MADYPWGTQKPERRRASLERLSKVLDDAEQQAEKAFQDQKRSFAKRRAGIERSLKEVDEHVAKEERRKEIESLKALGQGMAPLAEVIQAMGVDQTALAGLSEGDLRQVAAFLVQVVKGEDVSGVVKAMPKETPVASKPAEKPEAPAAPVKKPAWQMEFDKYVEKSAAFRTVLKGRPVDQLGQYDIEALAEKAAEADKVSLSMDYFEKFCKRCLPPELADKFGM